MKVKKVTVNAAEMMMPSERDRVAPCEWLGHATGIVVSHYKLILGFFFVFFYYKITLSSSLASGASKAE